MFLLDLRIYLAQIIGCKNLCYSIWSLVVAGRVLWYRVFLSICPSIRPFVCPSVGHFLGIFSLVFLNFGMLLETHLKLCVTELDFMEETFLLPKMGKWNKNGQKTGIFEYIEKCHYVLLNFNYNENLYYLLCSCTNPIFTKIFVSEVKAKMFSTSPIAGFFNQQFL